MADSNNVKPIATWLNKGYAEKIMKAANGYWDNTKDWLVWAVNQKNEQENLEPILSLLAWERLTDRLSEEPLALFRKRVQHALVNTVEAGEIASIADLFSRLGIDVIKVTERIENRDWDIIAIDFSSHTVSKYGEILPELIQLYGRTCRRYEFTVHTVVEPSLNIGCLDVQWDSVHIEESLVLQQSTDLELCHAVAFIGAQYDIQTATL
jgi:hypothetical protein